MVVDWLQTLTIGFASGAGSGIGSYLSNRLLIQHIEKLEKKLRGKGK